MSQFARQTKIINPSLLDKRILIIGAGGIGSWTALSLAKIGCQDITVMDFDEVALENIGSQIYTRKDIGRKKVDALHDIIGEMVSDPSDVTKPYNLQTREERWEPKTKIDYEIVISALDSMETRKQLWESIKVNPFILNYIDGRMGGEFMKILCLELTNASLELYAKYEKTILPPEKVDPTPCTAKAIAYNTLMIGSVITSMVKNICRSQGNPFDFSFDMSCLRTV